MKYNAAYSGLAFLLMRYLLIYVSVSFLFSCSVNFVPLPTLEERQFLRERAVEDHVRRSIRKENIANRYESLAFGPLIIYKTDDHLLLDSLFDVKYRLIEENNMRTFRKSGMEKIIAEQQRKARAREHELLFEMEHIYLVHIPDGDSVAVHHDFVVLNSSDSVIMHTRFYHYTFPSAMKNMAINYLFELHFITRRDSYISDAELDFIRFFKERETELIGSPELQTFMRHTLSLMQIAQSMNSVNYVTLTKYIAMRHLMNRYNQREVTHFAPLNMVEVNGRLIGYNLIFHWVNNQVQPPSEMITEIEFSPFLEVIKVSDRFVPEDDD
ncbi:MAG: hypothetical protein JJT77_10270 [Crocinitomicaceae bacterium]|nr:hypothetical protein [Crocinitomicaceae bacterium]